MDRIITSGPKAIIECVEDIPCNPCTTCCAKKAICLDGDSITAIPRVDESLCTGCGVCVACCPGMAIFVVDKNEGTVGFAHEFLPLPEVGEDVEATDKYGNYVCQGQVVKVMTSDKFDYTNVVTISVPTEHVEAVRGIRNPLKGVRNDER